MGNIWADYDAIDLCEERYGLAEGRIREIAAELGAAETNSTAGEGKETGMPGADSNAAHPLPEAFKAFFRDTASFIAELCGIRASLKSGDYDSHPEKWPEMNRRMYEDILPDHYEQSFANPACAERMLGADFGSLLCFLYTQERGLIAYVFEDKVEELAAHMELFIQVYGLFAEGLPKPEDVRETLYWFESDNTDVILRNRIRGQIDPACDDAVYTLMTLDTNDPSSLYRSGEYITENELRTFRYLASLPEAEIQRMADTFTEGYREGFILGEKPLYKKRTVSLIYHAGFERMMQAAVRNFLKMGLRPTIVRCGVSAVTGMSRTGGFTGASPNPQYDYDHREDAALFLDSRFVERKLEVTEAVYGEFLEQAHRYGGPAVLEVFGEPPFDPVSKKEALKYSEKQQALSVKLKNETARIVNDAIYGQERSFTIISFPVPTIDEERYEEIFRETMKVNTLDARKYSAIQQVMIDTLDKGTKVHILGRGKNRTDLTVQLWRLQDPAQETIFENCGADVNIPVGEVFTSPVLKGTDGVLFVSQVYLQGLSFRDLELHFKDGCITDYSCSNFETEEENRAYIEENILFHHKTLPMGEFAIGTNTTAYAMIQKYQIGPKMDILIAEKTGPHFAVGDTCYSWDEDNVTRNPDGKKIVARENDFSRLRKEDPSKAYFNCHTDITIPYEELGLIEVENEDGSWRQAVIRDGRFVLEGTEELNGPLDMDASGMACESDPIKVG